jgi:endophilin-B
MDFKKLASGAGTLFNRAKQYTEEKLGQAEKTDFDAPFEMLLDRAEKTKNWTEKILKQTETVLTPNPSARVEEFVYEKVQGSKPQRMLENDVLGQHMIDAGNDFGPGTSYGSALVKCGQTQQKLGQAKRDFIQATTNNFLQQLKAFLDTDVKTLQKERKTLETLRLDLDAAKAKLRRCKAPAGKVSAEAEVRVAQAEFDRQVEVTRLLLEGISSTHAHHLHCLHDLIEAQATYYAQCHQYMTDLQKSLGSEQH